MICDFINDLIDDYFRSRVARLDARGSWKGRRSWNADFRSFFEDVFRKWLASRSASTVNQLLDEGFCASDEQRIVRTLEDELDSFFRGRVKETARTSLLQIRSLVMGMSLWTIIFCVLAEMSSSVGLMASYLSCLIGGVCLGLAGILSCLNPKCCLNASRRFVERFFVDAELKWTNLEEHLKKERW